MVWKISIAIGLVFLILAGFYSCASTKVQRKTLFKGSDIHPWRIEYTNEQHFSAGKKQYYEVFYADKQIVIPKTFFKSKQDISQFVAAGGFEIQETNNDAVLLTVAFIPEDSEYNYRQYCAVFVKRGSTKRDFVVHDLHGAKIGGFQL